MGPTALPAGKRNGLNRAASWEAPRPARRQLVVARGVTVVPDEMKVEL